MGINESFKANQKEYGFRIYKIIPGFPLDNAHLKILEDFIIPSEEIFKERITFYDWIKKRAGTTIKTKIYSLKERSFKEIDLEVKPEGTSEGFLGGSVKLENIYTAPKKLLHVISVKKDSFADKQLGLVKNEDYLIALRVLKEEIFTLNQINDDNPHELFRNIIKNNLGKTCEFYIYNIYKGGRCVTVKIDNDDYFELGCDVAFGKIHEFPIEYIYDNDSENKKLREESGETQTI